MHKKARKQFTEDKQTKGMDYWNHVLWSDETKIHLFGSDGVKRVRRQPGEEYKDKCVLPTVKHGGGSVMAWGCMSAAGTGEFIEGSDDEVKGCEPVKLSTQLYRKRVHYSKLFKTWSCGHLVILKMKNTFQSAVIHYSCWFQIWLYYCFLVLIYCIK